MSSATTYTSRKGLVPCGNNDLYAFLNPFVKMVIGDAAEEYLEDLISAVEAYDGYDKIRGYTQSP